MTAIIARLNADVLPKLGTVWTLFAIILAALALLDPAQFWPSLRFAFDALLSTLPFIVFAVALIAGLNATGAASELSKIFEGREVRMIFLAAIFGGLAPFCSCEVIPFIAALLAVGTPLSAVMAFWLASPLIDPPSLVITAGAIGWHFAIGKAVAAVGIGIVGGFAIKWIVASGALAEPLKERPASGCGSCGADPLSANAVWAFWKEDERIATFKASALENFAFLMKWLAFAYLLESLLIAYVPAGVSQRRCCTSAGRRAYGSGHDCRCRHGVHGGRFGQLHSRYDRRFRIGEKAGLRALRGARLSGRCWQRRHLWCDGIATLKIR